MAKFKKANNFIFILLRAFFRPFLFFKYGLRFDRTVSRYVKRPCIIVSNHTTVHDQFIVGIGFKFAINFVASDSLFRSKFNRLLLHLFAKPIPIAKGSSDPSAIKNIMTVIKDGGAVGIFPEGNRSFFGETGYFKPTIGKLAKKLKVPLVIVNIRGGFNTDPRWRRKTSKGRMTAAVTKIISPSDMEGMTENEINDAISRGISFNEFEYNAKKRISFKGNRKAEYLETALFACPECGSFTDLRSDGNEFYCNGCGARVRFDDCGRFEKVQNADKLPETVLEWSRIQLEQIKAKDYSEYSDKPVFSDDGVKINICERAKKQRLLGVGSVALYNDRITAGEYTFPLSEITDLAIHGIRKLQIYMQDGKMYMIEAKERTNVLKYMACGYHLLHDIKQTEDDYFGY